MARCGHLSVATSRFHHLEDEACKVESLKDVAAVAPHGKAGRGAPLQRCVADTRECHWRSEDVVKRFHEHSRCAESHIDADWRCVGCPGEEEQACAQRADPPPRSDVTDGSEEPSHQELTSRGKAKPRTTS